MLSDDDDDDDDLSLSLSLPLPLSLFLWDINVFRESLVWHGLIPRTSAWLPFQPLIDGKLHLTSSIDALFSPSLLWKWESL